MKETGFATIDRINERIEEFKGTRHYGRLRGDRYTTLLFAYTANDANSFEAYMKEAKFLLNELGLTDEIGTASLYSDARRWHDSWHWNRPKVTAAVTLQRWVNDYAVTVDEIEFDCTAALDEFDLSDLPYDGDFYWKGYCDYGDDVFYASVALGLTSEWDGPFEFYIKDGFEDYMDERVEREYGVEVREA